MYAKNIITSGNPSLSCERLLTLFQPPSMAFVGVFDGVTEHVEMRPAETQDWTMCEYMTYGSAWKFWAGLNSPNGRNVQFSQMKLLFLDGMDSNEQKDHMYFLLQNALLRMFYRHHLSFEPMSDGIHEYFGRT